MTVRNKQLDISRLTAEQAARLLRQTHAGSGMSAKDIRSDVAGGAPANADGTIDLVQYGAWLLISGGNA